MFSLMMPVVALAPTFALFIAGLSMVNFALNGEWSLGSMLVAETWPARLRGRVISINRATWCFGVALAGGIIGIVAASWGWRVAVMVPGMIALLAIYVHATCPESPYWVCAQDRKRRIAETLSAGGALNEDDRCGMPRPRVSIRQMFMPDVLPAALVALFVTCSSCCILGTVGSWMPYFCRLRSTGRRRSIALSMCAWASFASSAYGWRAGWPTGSAGALASPRC
ncbi:MAG TPA: MFS transporter [Stellaceae bacterium]